MFEKYLVHDYDLRLFGTIRLEQKFVEFF